MTLETLLSLIENGENLTVEFKEKFSEHKKIAKEIIAFANTKGGILIFGVRDNRKIVGIPSEKEIVELITETVNFYTNPKIDFEVEYFEIKKKLLAVFFIKESKNKPHRIEDYNPKFDIRTAEVYIRIADKSVPAGKEMIKLMMIRNNEEKLKNYSIGKNERIVFEFLEKNEFITAKQLSKLANISSRRASRTLLNLVRADSLLIHSKDNGENFFSIK